MKSSFVCLSSKYLFLSVIIIKPSFSSITSFIPYLQPLFMKNRADYTKKWYQIYPWENKLYQFLRVKAWKNKMPTYNPESFSYKKHSWNEIAQAMCQSELVHETNIILSFIPLIVSKWFGSFYIFLITSVCSAIFDLLFVIMQRYNRVRVIKIALRKR